MALRTWTGIARRHRTVLALIALLSAFAGTGLLLDRPKGSGLQWLGLPFLIVGGGLFAWAVWPKDRTVGAGSKTTLASRLVLRITGHGRLTPLFPVIGVALITADLAYNFFLSATPALLAEDTMVLLVAGVLLAYGFVPVRFARERDFVFVFCLALNAILVLPLLVARLYAQDFERSVDLYSWIALAPETGAVLNLLGVANNVHAVPGSTAPGLTFTPQHLGTPVTVVITTACSGIYSFGIFASAFLAFVLTEYERPSRRIWSLLGLGFFTAYAANVLRMVVIVLVGYYTDTVETDLQNMLVAHSYAGWFIFLAWIALFWGLLFRFLPVEKAAERRVPEKAAQSRRELRCTLCRTSLTPALAAVRCSCGAYIHRDCLRGTSGCPRCGRPASVVLGSVADVI
jgi:exosortase/archaeosortase family protein